MIAGRARKMGLGDYDRVTLAEARKKATAAHLLVVDGIDPIEERNARKAAQAVEKAKTLSFKECAERYIASHKADGKAGNMLTNGRRRCRPMLIRLSANCRWRRSTLD